MTPEQIFAEYLRREREANATVKGQDPCAIIEDMAHALKIDSAEITEVVLDHSLAGAC